MSLFLVAGLGNPGREYESTRHNIGFSVVEALARQHALAWKTSSPFQADFARWDRRPGQSVLLVKPLTYMNESGRALSALVRFYKLPISSVIVIYDDLTLDVGLAKLSVKGSSGGHNGVASILEHLGDGFVRYRLGIGPKSPREIDLKDYVLGTFTSDQQSILAQRHESTLKGLLTLLDQGVDRAMNLINRREKPNEPDQTELPRDLHP